MSAPPAPLVQAEVNLRDFPYLPLDAARLRDSDMIVEISAEEFRTAILLWCACWHQIPAGSLPTDNIALAQLAGFGRSPGGMKDWRKVRAGALRGFVECSDGRLYHRVIAEKVNEAWSGKLRLRHKRELDRVKKAAQRAKSEPDFPTFDEWNLLRLSSGTDHFSRGGHQAVVLGTVPGTSGGSPQNVGSDVPEKLAQKGKGERGEGRGERGEVKEKASGADQPAVGDAPLEVGRSVDSPSPLDGNEPPYTPGDVSRALSAVGVSYHCLNRQEDRDRMVEWVSLGCSAAALAASIAEAGATKPLSTLSTGYLDKIVRRRIFAEQHPGLPAPNARAHARNGTDPADMQAAIAEAMKLTAGEAVP